MCLSTVYEVRGDERLFLCKNCAEIGEVNGQLVMTDIMGIKTRVFGEIEKIDLMENVILIRRYDFDIQASETHTHADGTTHTHAHDHSREHAHHHSPEEKKKQLNRMSRAIGHSQHVKSMIANDEDCAAVLTQLSAVTSALRGLGKEIINEHMTHCIIHAIEDGDMSAVEDFQEAVKKFI
ncbi:MAG: metal-sensing transcriptional repressor [Clostridiales bacterium]|nr:metal-sensing transcriptional repressor [Candidatus Crickella merdequi]